MNWEDRAWLGGLAAIAVWIYVVLPFLYVGTDLVTEQSKPYYQSKPTTTKNEYNPTADWVIDEGKNQSDSESKEHKHWYDTIIERPTDWLLVLFNLILAFFTARLYYATYGLVRIGREQSKDMKASIAIADDAASSAKRAANIAERAIVLADRPWLKVYIEPTYALDHHRTNY
jgi:hypothetical protein